MHAHMQGAIVLYRHPRMVVLAVVGIVDFTVFPRTFVSSTKAGENCEPQEGSCTQRGVRIFRIYHGQALIVAGPFEPDQLPA